MVKTEYKVSGEDRSFVTEETAEFTTSEPPAEPEAEPQPEPIQGVVESCPVCGDAIVGDHYHRETADGEEVVRTKPNIHKQRALRALEQRRHLKPHG